MKNIIVLPILIITGITACNNITPHEPVKTKEVAKYESAWKDTFGEVDPQQSWIFSQSASIEVNCAGDAEVSVSTLGEEKRVVLAKRIINGSATISFNMPSGLQRGVAVCCKTAEGTFYKGVGIETLASGSAKLDFGSAVTKAEMPEMPAEFKAALTRATEINPLTGKNAKIYGYTNFPAWIWADINAAIPETRSVLKSDIISSFGLQSNGKFYVALIYGSTGAKDGEIGYYFYDPATPEDVTYIPFVEAIQADYYYDNDKVLLTEPLAKVQWLSKETKKWESANFLYYDKIDGMTSSESAWNSRRGDNQYSIIDIEQKYGNANPELSKIDMVRGLTFQIDAPEGNMVGFYCKRKAYINHSSRDLNNDNIPRAAIKVYDGFRFIGIEDGNADSSSEPDCNDIVLVMVPGNDGALPGLLLPYIKDNDENKYYNGDGTKTEEPKYDFATDGAKDDDLFDEIGNLAEEGESWTLAFEDICSEGDFDFNDVILSIVPRKEGKADVVICATGGSLRTNLFYKDKLIGEVHELLGSVSGGRFVIANTASKKYPVKTILSIDWDENTKIEDVARDFQIVAGNNLIKIPQTTGEIPMGIVLPGTWAWPMESVNINVAYTGFPEDAQWYRNPVSGNTVPFFKSDIN